MKRACLLIVLLAAVLRFWGLASGLPHPLTRPDEEVLLARLVFPARGEFNLHYAVYPSAYFYLTWLWCAGLLGAGRALGLVASPSLLDTLSTHPEHVLLLARALSATAATLTVALLMSTARRTLGHATALCAGALLATSVLHVRDAHAAKPDALLVFGVTAALALLARLAHTPTRGRALAAGTAIGLTTGMKYPGLLLMVPAWVTTAAATTPGLRRWLLPPHLVLVGTAAAVAFVATSPYLFFDPDSLRALVDVFGSIFPGLLPDLAAPRLPIALAALTPPRQWWSGYAYHFAISLRHGAGLLPTLLGVPALAWGLATTAPVGRIAAAWVVVYLAIHGLSPMLLARYMTPILPALFLLEAGCLAAMIRRMPTAWRVPAAATLLTALCAMPLANSIAYDRILARPDTRLLATAWLAKNAPVGSRVLVAGTFFWPYGEPLMPPGIEQVRLDAGATTFPPDIDFVLGHDHPTFASRFDPAALPPVPAGLRLVLDLDPFVGPREGPVFEYLDAYYVPLDRFAAVERPGPRIRIYAVGG